MQQFGGGFVRRLAEAAFVADPENLRRLREAFPEYWNKYAKLAEKIESQPMEF